MKRPRPPGFTLIELIISVMIIALLAALAFPVIGKLRQSGHIARCATNLRTIGGGVSLYAADHDGRFPVSRLQYTMDKDGSKKTVSFLADLLNRLYFKQADVTTLWWCPADTERPVAQRKHSYGHNQRLGGDKANPLTWNGDSNPNYDPRYAGFRGVVKPLSQVIFLIEFVDTADQKWSSVVTGSRWPMGTGSNPDQPPAGRVDFSRHSQVANALMLDGSVRAFTLGDLLHTGNHYITPE